MKLKKLRIIKFPITYESSYKYKFQTKLVLLWWTLRVGLILKLTLKSKDHPLRNLNFWLIILPVFKEGVING